ncbi:CACTA transposable element [Tanacetum coccineum]
MLPNFFQIVNQLYAFIYETKHSKSGLGLPSIVALDKQNSSYSFVMTIDKSWTTISSGNSNAFLDGLFAFIAHCEPLLHPITRKIRCPCSRCCNCDNLVTLKTLEVHISRHGFDQHYTTWKYHGEPILPLPPPVPHSPEHIDMDAFFKDISANNVPTPPTQTTGPQPAQTTGPNNEFEELLSRSTQKLYPGCDMTTLEFTSEISHIKVLHKISDAGFNKILALLQKACSPSKGYNFPSSYYEIKKTYKKIGLGYESIHACINDCFLFWGSEENKKMPNCPICKASRWKDPKKTKGKKVANKVVRYFPLTPRLQRMFNTKHIAKWMTWHATGQSKENGKMNHPCDGRAWKHFDMMKPEFSGDPRNVRLGLAADGFNPFGMMSQNYSMWLPLIKELQELWAGVWMKDAATGTHFQMKAAVLWTINDFSARSSLSGWSGQGYYACLTCNKDTPSMLVKHKIAYVGYRRFLRRWPTGPVPAQCQGLTIRGVTTNRALRRAFRDNREEPLTVGFDIEDQGTFYPLGVNASYLNSLMGEQIRPLPLACKWEEIPPAYKAHILPTLETYFNLAEWYNRQDKVVVDDNVYKVGERVRLGLELKLRLLWRKRKTRIKAEHFKIHEMPDDAKAHMPPLKVWDDKTQEDWEELVDWWSHPDRVAKSVQNAANRAKNTIVTHQGKKPFVQGRQEYEEMKAMKDHIRAGIIPFKTDQEILDEIVPSDNRQNMSGRGRKLPGGGSTSRRYANRAFGDVMSREQITQLYRQEQQEKELYRKQAEEAQARAWLAAQKADAAQRRADQTHDILVPTTPSLQLPIKPTGLIPPPYTGPIPPPYTGPIPPTFVTNNTFTNCYRPVLNSTMCVSSSSNSQIPEAERTRYTLQTNPHMNDLRTVEELARDLARDNNNESSSGEEEVEESGGDYSDED